MGIIPKIKKDLQSFFLDERGDISKQTLISFGALVVGLQTISIISKDVLGQSVQAKHDHCDPGHANAGYHSSAHGNGGWHGSGTGAHGNAVTHSSADGVPISHCNWSDHANAAAHGSHNNHGSCCHSSSHGSASDHGNGNVGHTNAVQLNYG